MSVLELRGVSKRYGSVQALDECAFRGATGRLTGIVGPHGAGKRTAMRVIFGLRSQTRLLGRVAGLSRARAGLAADRWLEALGLTDRAAARLDDLSHGNQQRVQLPRPWCTIRSWSSSMSGCPGPIP